MSRPRRRQRPVKDYVVKERKAYGRFTDGLRDIVQKPPLSSNPTRAEVRDRQCGDKIRYLSETTARNAATLMNWTGRVVGDPVDWYACPWCSKPGDTGWHVGHNRYPRPS